MGRKKEYHQMVLPREKGTLSDRARLDYLIWRGENTTTTHELNDGAKLSSEETTNKRKKWRESTVR